ncbi:hypothetical protein RRG08_027930 [Elysia crispata]|uniref:Secreted protein n=1 Tax=Elysia crispata TaxID=231223 RepID=A0AAE1CUH3_9GAST|nr:hypothetical protein RRG08_027930 [Elysia crispata]
MTRRFKYTVIVALSSVCMMSVAYQQGSVFVAGRHNKAVTGCVPIAFSTAHNSANDVHRVLMSSPSPRCLNGAGCVCVYRRDLASAARCGHRDTFRPDCFGDGCVIISRPLP